MIFCYWKVKESKYEILLIAHNLFGYDMFYFIKGYRASAWGSKDLNFGRNNLTNINFGNEIKFIDTLKYYQKRLGELTSTLTENEKKSVKTLALQFLNQHYYFGEIWKFSSDAQKTRILDIISEGKGIIPYEKIVNMNSLFCSPERTFFEKTGFFSELKQKAVSNEDYTTSFYLYKTLKM